MKICDSWLREWIDHGLDPEAVAERLTMLGLEVESVGTAGVKSGCLRVGEVVEKHPHPGADRLSLCRVDVAAAQPLPIVCGAANVRVGGRYVTALEGAVLAGGLQVRPRNVRGEASAGMLCSAAELGLEGASGGLMELDPGAPVGSDASDHLSLGDAIFDINVTPNRADCLSVAGVARDLAAGIGIASREADFRAVEPLVRDRYSVALLSPDDCPRFAGRVIRGIDAQARTPLWMRERLRRSGVRPIHPVVDVTNYVMLELGQPMHSYDLARLQGRVEVRRARAGEPLTLMDGRQLQLDPRLLVIADERGAISLAGIMGGEATAVSAETCDVLLESAYFAPAAVAGRARHLGLHTEASLRFERGVDPSLQVHALERATRLIVQIAGGQPGPVDEASVREKLPIRTPVRLRRTRTAKVLGVVVPDTEVTAALSSLNMEIVVEGDGWLVTPPPARFDVEREEDLLEEVARVFGYERIPEVPGAAQMHPVVVGDAPDSLAAARATLVARGFQEAITYSFVDWEFARRFGAEDWPQLVLANPIASDMSVMRQSLWPGLVRAARENLHRQNNRVRLFEIGVRFIGDSDGGHGERTCIAGIALGSRLPEQWGVPVERLDVFDLKSDVEALLNLAGMVSRFSFVPASHPALHPGRCALIRDGDRAVGWLGEVHPALAHELEIPAAALFEIDAEVVTERRRAQWRPLSRYPSVRRDLALIVDRDLPIARLLDCIGRSARGVLLDAFVFDIYNGPQIAPSEKSVAIGLILQDTSRTLTDADADAVVNDVRVALAREFQARIRE